MPAVVLQAEEADAFAWVGRDELERAFSGHPATSHDDAVGAPAITVDSPPDAADAAAAVGINGGDQLSGDRGWSARDMARVLAATYDSGSGAFGVGEAHRFALREYVRRERKVVAVPVPRGAPLAP